MSRWVLLGFLALLLAGCVGPQVEYKTEFEVFIAGENEICGTSACGGEGIGQASIEIHDDAGELCYDLDLQDLPASTSAHIHEGGLEDVGPVVVDLAWQSDDPGASGCVEGIDYHVLRGIIENPRMRYLDVHSETYPEGAARGQFQT